MDKKSKLVKECEIRGKDASCLCFKCINYYCDRCYKVIHDIKEDPEHKKENIDPYVPIDVKCTEHPNNPCSLFCVEEKGNIYFL